jgi:cytochrome c oxidase subunit 4
VESKPAVKSSHRRAVQRYLKVWAALVVLTGATVVLGRLPLGGLNTPVALGIALAKALLVVVFFMHLMQQRATPRLVVLTTAVLIATLLLFTVGDVATRLPLTNPPTSESAQPYHAAP